MRIFSASIILRFSLRQLLYAEARCAQNTPCWRRLLSFNEDGHFQAFRQRHLMPSHADSYYAYNRRAIARDMPLFAFSISAAPRYAAAGIARFDDILP